MPADHPIRAIREMVDKVLEALSARFDEMYSAIGRPSIAPEKLLRALLVQLFYSIRSERQLREQLNYNLLFRWFVGLNVDEEVWDPTIYTRNRERLLAGNVPQEDGTLIEAWASQKSFQRKDRGAAEPPDGSGEPDGELPWREAQQRHATGWWWTPSCCRPTGRRNGMRRC